MVSGGVILCLGVVATIVFFIAQAHKVTSGLFDSVHRSAKALEGASQVGLDQGKFRELLQGLSTELAIVKDKLKTKEDKDLVMFYDAALKIYQDSLLVWEVDARKSELRVCSKSPISGSVSVDACMETDLGTSPRSAGGASTESC